VIDGAQLQFQRPFLQPFADQRQDFGNLGCPSRIVTAEQFDGGSTLEGSYLQTFQTDTAIRDGDGQRVLDRNRTGGGGKGLSRCGKVAQQQKTSGAKNDDYRQDEQ